jgi:hypothetical protein
VVYRIQNNTTSVVTWEAELCGGGRYTGGNIPPLGGGYTSCVIRGTLVKSGGTSNISGIC